jgi:hypothetical protein
MKTDNGFTLGPGAVHAVYNLMVFCTCVHLLSALSTTNAVQSMAVGPVIACKDGSPGTEGFSFI